MVRHYVRKTDRQKWSSGNMERAVEAVMTGEMGYKRASENFSVPSSTLERYVKKKRENVNAEIDKTAGKYQPVFTAEQETELASYLIDMQRRLFGVTIKELRRLAYQLAERNKCKHNFNRESEMAGEDWAKIFFNRHPELSLRKPEATSGARAMGFNKMAVSQFFSLLEKVVDEHHLSASSIYNYDETGVTVNPKQLSKVIAAKGQRQVGALTSAERGNTITAEICFSASGVFMPPMLIFPRKRKQKEFEVGLPPGGWAEVNDSGWMTAETFQKWFLKFIEFSKATKENPVLLLLDGHSSHTKNLQVIEEARNNGVILLCFPPHCSHRLQPLDVSFMKPLSLHYDEEARKWLRTNPGKMITLFEISMLFGQAFLNSANMRTAINGFEETGIWPVNPNIFTDTDFLPSLTTDIELAATLTNSSENIQLVPSTADSEITRQRTPERNNNPTPVHKTPEKHDDQDLEPIQKPQDFPDSQTLQDITNMDIDLERPGCSWMSDTLSRPAQSTVFASASPRDLLPLPKVKSAQRRAVRKRGKTAILTASPYKAELQEALEKTEKAKKNKLDRMKKNELTSKKKGKQKKTKKNENYDSDSSENEEASCLYCNELYSKSIEGWCSCANCHRWAHLSCAGLDSDDDESVLICELCTS